MALLPVQGSYAQRMGLLLSLYICQGLPTGIFTQALPAILRQYGVPLTVISFSSLLAVPWVLKFLIAPFIDEHYFSRIGQRRTWILPMQLLAILAVIAIAFFNPHQLIHSEGIVIFFLLMFLVNLFAATQDVATDGLAVNMLAFHERGVGNGIQVAGYRLGLIIGGGLLLYIIGSVGWQLSFFMLAILLVVLTLPILSFREAAPVVTPHKPMPWLSVFQSFFNRPGLKGWLIVLMVYKAGESLGTAMVKPMLIDMGLDLKQIGLMVSMVGSLAALTGALLGGWLTTRVGRRSAMVGFGVFQALAVASYAVLSSRYAAGQPLDVVWVYGINALEHFAAGMAMAALLTAVMDLCRPEHAGADFSIQVSILAAFGGVFHLAAGFVADSLGYSAYFLVSAGLALVLLWPVALYSRELPWLIKGLPVVGTSGENAQP